MSAPVDVLAAPHPLPEAYPGWESRVRLLAPGEIPIRPFEAASMAPVADPHHYAERGLPVPTLDPTSRLTGHETSPAASNIEQLLVEGESKETGSSFKVQMAWSPSSAASKPRAVVYLGLGASGWLIPRVVQQLERLGMYDVMVVGDVPTDHAPTDKEPLEGFMVDAVSVVMAEIHKRFEVDETYAPVVVGESKAAAPILEAGRVNHDLFKGKRRLIQPFGLNDLAQGEFVLRMLEAGLLHREQFAPAPLQTIKNIARTAMGLPVLGTESFPERGPQTLLGRIKKFGRAVVAAWVGARRMSKQLDAGLAYNGVEEFWRQYGMVGSDGLKAVVGRKDPVFRLGELATNLPEGAVMVSENTHITMASDSGAQALYQTIMEAYGEESTLTVPDEAWVRDLKEQRARQAILDTQVAYDAMGALLFQLGVFTPSDVLPSARDRSRTRATGQ